MPNATFTLRSPMPVSAGELYDWHSRPLAFRRLLPPWEQIDITHTTGAFGTDGYLIDFRARLFGPIHARWSARAFDFQPGKQFQDQQLKGPFAFWNHTHRMIPNGPNASFLEEFIEYRLPLGFLGKGIAGGGIRKRLEAVFAYRHALTRNDLERHQIYRDRPRLTIAVTGSRGLVGSELVPFLTTGGHRIVRLVTGKGGPSYDDGTRWLNWNPEAKIDPGLLEGVDAVIHLAGDNVASNRWSSAKKKKILDSRTIPTGNLAAALAAMPPERRPKVFLSASAIGFYGSRGDETLNEDSQRGVGFFPDVCQAWEEATAPAREAGIRTVNLRIGVVLTPRDGALGKQLLPFKLGAGAVLGSGRQWVAWITIGDLIGAIHHCLMNELKGAVNCVAPRPVTNREFAKSLGLVLHRPAFFWLPRPFLQVVFGELADNALLASIRANPGKLLDSGFVFEHSELIPALKFVLGKV